MGEAKADAKAEAKREAKALEEAENADLSKLKGANKGSQKLTQAELARRQALLAMAKPAAKKTAKSLPVAQPVVEANVNRDNIVEATGVDAALAALEAPSKAEKVVTYKEFEARVLEEVKADNPGLKLSQVKEKVQKLWDRSPDNPKNATAT